MGFFDKINKIKTATVESPKTESDSSEQYRAKRDKDREYVNSLPELTSTVCDGHRRRYHYKNVTLNDHVFKTYGAKRGDVIELVASQTQFNPNAILLVHNGNVLGALRNNRMQNMVHEWNENNLPVVAVVSYVGKSEVIYFEIAFYGYPKKKV